MAQIDGDAVLADGHSLDQKMDDARLLRRVQRRPKLIEPAECCDDCLFIDGWALVSEGLDRSGRDLRRAYHAPDFADDSVLDHPCGQAQRA